MVDTTTPIKEVLVDGVSVPLAGGSSGENKFDELVDGTLTELTAEDLKGVSNIKRLAFSDCTNLASVIIPQNVISIGDNAFQRCPNITSIIIPDSVTSMGIYVFQKCTGLTSAIIGNRVPSIGAQAFFGCTNLTSVTIGNSVTEIGESAFSGCTGLTSIEIPASMTKISSRAFYSCTALTEITINATVPPTLSGTTSTIPSNVTTIYIPAGTLEAYSAATNWSTFADKFVEKEM